MARLAGVVYRGNWVLTILVREWEGGGLELGEVEGGGAVCGSGQGADSWMKEDGGYRSPFDDCPHLS